jgi:hypothetical protein
MPGLLIKGVTWGTLGLAFLGIAAAPWWLHCSFIERLTHVRFYWIGTLLGLLIWWAVRKRWLPALVAMALLMGREQVRAPRCGGDALGKQGPKGHAGRIAAPMCAHRRSTLLSQGLSVIFLSFPPFHCCY